MPLSLRPLSERDARAVCLWRYPAPYDAYDLPPWEEVIRLGWAIGQPDIRKAEFLSLHSESGLTGWLRLKDCGDCVLLGVGLAPEACGHGLGVQALRLALDEAYARYGALPVRLEVRAFNRRAVRCYERAGFHELSRRTADAPHGQTEFILMEHTIGWHGNL